jgi:hypothetical protein
MSSMGPILGLLMLVAVISIAVVFATGVFAEAEQGVNMTGSEYEDEYESITDTSILTLEGASLLPYILGVVAVVIAIALAAKYVL